MKRLSARVAHVLLGSGFRVQGPEFRVQGSGFRVYARPAQPRQHASVGVSWLLLVHFAHEKTHPPRAQGIGLRKGRFEKAECQGRHELAHVLLSVQGLGFRAYLTKGY